MYNSFAPEGVLYGSAENTELIRSVAGLRLAQQTKRTVEAVAVSCGRTLDLKVDLCGMTGIIPYDKTVYSENGTPPKDIAVITRVGKPVCFKVTGFTETTDGETAILSRADAQRECIDDYLSYLLPGDVIGCRVTHTEKFGAFADVGCGVPALLPIDRISVSRISHASDRLRNGMDLRCIVSKTETGPFRLFLTLKEMLGTWEENAADFTPGQTVRGIVRGVEPYGVFIELAPNLSGLSEYSGDVEPGDEVAVYIKSIDRRKMKVKLVIVGKQGKAADPGLKYYVGEDVTHVYRFIYSAPGALKYMETDFS
ncbi:MAG: 30S ribosomal protein S1 [Clostridia bacterium]|nr:30S ribosomal protein S1 [Clostridia bacterium]